MGRGSEGASPLLPTAVDEELLETFGDPLTIFSAGRGRGRVVAGD